MLPVERDQVQALCRQIITWHKCPQDTIRLIGMCRNSMRLYGKRKSFVDDLNMERGVVSTRVVLHYDLLRFSLCSGDLGLYSLSVYDSFFDACIYGRRCHYYYFYTLPYFSKSDRDFAHNLNVLFFLYIKSYSLSTCTHLTNNQEEKQYKPF